MMMVREIMYCKPGKVKPLVEKFIAMDKIGQRSGMPKFKVMTDFCGERFWTVIAEMEVPNMQEFEKAMSGDGMSEADTKEMEGLMKGYHDLVDYGRREIYKLEN